MTSRVTSVRSGRERGELDSVGEPEDVVFFLWGVVLDIGLGFRQFPPPFALPSQPLSVYEPYWWAMMRPSTDKVSRGGTHHAYQRTEWLASGGSHNSFCYLFIRISLRVHAGCWKCSFLFADRSAESNLESAHAKGLLPTHSAEACKTSLPKSGSTQTWRINDRLWTVGRGYEVEESFCGRTYIGSPHETISA